MHTIYYSAIDFISRIVNLLFGVAVVAILILIFVGTSLDLMYMLNPLLSSSMDKLLDGKRLGGFRLISKDAVLAKEEAAVNNTHVMFVYLKRRIKTYIIASVVVYLLIVGPDRLINYVYDFLVPFLKAAKLLKD